VSSLLDYLRHFDYGQLLRAIVDISVVSYILYRVIVLAKGRRAWQILIGLGIFFLLLFGSERLGMITLNWLLRQITPLGPVAIVILFYPELREVLEKLGHAEFWGAPSLTTNRKDDILESIEATVRAALILAATKTGALVVLERETHLDDIAHSGTILGAKATTELLTTIFYEGTALHDGAVILRNDKILAAGCTLPLSMEANIASNVHMRHRAAMGVTENSDAVVVIVSEETGTISVSLGGKLERGFKSDTLRQRLLEIFGLVKSPRPRVPMSIPRPNLSHLPKASDLPLRRRKPKAEAIKTEAEAIKTEVEAAIETPSEEKN
jgi:diadenylate cyclase